MSAIANFKKRREAQRAQQTNVEHAEHALSTTPAIENEALTLLAALLGCDVDNAIPLAKELLEQGAYIDGLVEKRVAPLDDTTGDDTTGDDIADEKSKEPQNDTVTADLERAASDIESSASNVEGAADAVTDAAEQISSAAGGLEDTANQLAYSAEDIGQATAQLKEATDELKKPSAAPRSSRGGRAAAQKNSLKK